MLFQSAWTTERHAQRRLGRAPRQAWPEVLLTEEQLFEPCVAQRSNCAWHRHEGLSAGQTSEHQENSGGARGCALTHA